MPAAGGFEVRCDDADAGEGAGPDRLAVAPALQRALPSLLAGGHGGRGRGPACRASTSSRCAAAFVLGDRGTRAPRRRPRGVVRRSRHRVNTGSLERRRTDSTSASSARCRPRPAGEPRAVATACSPCRSAAFCAVRKTARIGRVGPEEAAPQASKSGTALRPAGRTRGTPSCSRRFRPGFTRGGAGRYRLRWQVERSTLQIHRSATAQARRREPRR